MICRWDSILSILPEWIVCELHRFNTELITEIRMRINAPVEIVLHSGIRYISGKVLQSDIDHCINCASSYSPWAATTINKGFLTIKGGHRIGICGEATYINGCLSGIKNYTSLCIRVAKDFPGIGKNCFPIEGSVLVLGGPGRGKTTLLRDISRQISEKFAVSVVDERGELFPTGIQRGKRMDVFTGISKNEGIEIMLRTLSPDYIVVDEITNLKDCLSLLDADGCGVMLLATAHAGSIEDFYRRKTYRPLASKHIFHTVIILQEDKSYTVERIKQ